MQSIPGIVKRIVIVAVMLVVLPVSGAVVYVLLSDASLVKAVVEAMATDFTGVQVHIGKMELSLGAGRGTLSDVTIFNPPPFKAESAIHLGQLTVAIDLSTLAGSPLVVREVAVADPEAVLEVGADGRSNLQVIGEHAKAEMRGDTAGTSPASRHPGRKLVVDRLDITGGRLAVAAPPHGASAGRLADVHLTGLGGDDGAPAMVIADAVLSAVAKSADGALPAERTAKP